MTTVYYVSTTGNDSTGNGSQLYPYATIAKAITRASDNDVIEVLEGTYTSNFDVNKVVTINGSNKEKSGTSESRVNETILENTKSNITANATLDGFTFKHTANISDALILQSQATIKNCIFERFATGTGQTVRAISTSSNASNYLIANNLFTGSTDGGLFSGHKTWNSALFFTNTNGNSGTIEYNTFRNCRTAFNADENNSNITLQHNDFLNCGTYISFGGISPISTGMNILSNTFNVSSLPSAFINNSNVTDSFRLNIVNNNFKFEENIYTSPELTLDQKFIIESKMYHKGRSSRNGIVYYSANEQCVIFGQTTIVAALFYASSTGETIHIGTGTYINNITINKPVTLLGQGTSTILEPLSDDPTVQITDGASGTTIKNLMVKGTYATQSTSGSGDSSNNKSAIYILNTNIVDNLPINDLLLENLVIQQASNGIAFNNKHSTNVSIKSCTIKQNEGSGIRIASNTETMNGFSVDTCIIENNNLNAINSNPSGSYRPNCTNYTIENCTIRDNNLLTSNNSHDVSIFGFNGNIVLSNTSIKCNHSESKLVNGSPSTTGGWGLIIFGSNNPTTSSSGNITMLNVTMTGNVIKSCLGFDRYSMLGDISITNLNIKDCEANQANQTWLQLSVGHMDTQKSFDLGTTYLKTMYTTSIGNVNATNSFFYDFDDGRLLNPSITADLLIITNQIFDKTDYPDIGKVIIIEGETVITSTVPNAINNALSNEGTGENVANIVLMPGLYELTNNLTNNSSYPKTIVSFPPGVIWVRETSN